MNVKAGERALVIGGHDYRPQDIGLTVEVLGWIEDGGAVDFPGYEVDVNEAGEPAWAVIVDAPDGKGITMKRDAWLMPWRKEKADEYAFTWHNKEAKPA